MSDDTTNGTDRPSAAAVSIEQLLEAERAGERLLADAQRQAKLRVEEAYKQAQSIDHRSRQRIEALNRACKVKNDRLVGEIESEARSFGTKSIDIGHKREALLAATARLAARLTTGET